MKILRNISRILIGIVFIFSGFVKVIDPLGYSYKFIEYFDAMGLTFMSGGSLVFAMLMAAAELLLGIALFFNLVPKFSAWVLLLFMIMFTPLTLWLAVANPVTDCGCFGDALVITNWQTFFKNLIIDVFVVIIFLQRAKYKPAYNAFFQWSLACIFILAVFGLEFYCLKNLPIVDFRPYHIGANIKEGMSIPDYEKNNLPIIENVFIYEKDNIQKEFILKGSKLIDLSDNTEHDYSVFTNEWKFVDRKDKIIKAGYVPPIHDFTIQPVYIEGFSAEPADDIFVNLNDYKFIYSNKEGLTEQFGINNLPDSSWTFQTVAINNNLITIDVSKIVLNYSTPENTEQLFSIKNLPSTNYKFLFADDYVIQDNNPKLKYGEDIANYILNNNNFSFLAIMTKLEDANENYLKSLDNVAIFCNENGYDFYCLTGSTEDGIRTFIEKHNPHYYFYNTDQTTLKTIIRSNPGLVLLRNGIVLNKWSGNKIPEFNAQKDLQADSMSKNLIKRNNYLYLGFALSLFVFMAIFHIIYNWMLKKKIIL